MKNMVGGKIGMGMTLSAKLNGISCFGSHGVLITDPSGEYRDEKGCRKNCLIVSLPDPTTIHQKIRHGICLGTRGAGQSYHSPIRKIRPFCKGGGKHR